MERLDIGIVMINFNNAELTINSLKTIKEHTSDKLNYKIIVVDNASEIDDFKNLKKAINELPDSFPIQLVRSRINTGFGGGNMMGVQHLNADYYAFINNDTLLQNDCLSILKEFMDSHKEVGIAGAQMLDQHGNQIPSFGHFPSLAREIIGTSYLELINKKKHPRHRKIYQEPLKVNYVNGSFMLCKSSYFDNVGGFDTNLFLFFEESDISLRLLKEGNPTYLVPEARYLHYQGKSMPDSINRKIELKTSLFYVVRKHYGYLHYLFLWLFFIIRYGFTSLVKPKYFPLFYRILIGMPLSKSLRFKYKIVDGDFDV